MFKTFNYSPNFKIAKRKLNQIKFIIVHYTGMKRESEAIKKLTDIKSKVSCHYLIKNNGEIVVMVPDLYEAWHAGASLWKNYKSLNKHSIGIEISNPGHAHNYKKFSKKQIQSLKRLSQFLIKKYRINKKNILGHSDIAPTRKKDPGEKFPWKFFGKLGN
jgi:N-acetylmuramoyl-L-alanine amidase